MTPHELTLVHYSKKPIAVVHSVEQKQFAADDYRSKYEKPKGLWLSVEGGDDSWAAWCKAEDFNLENLTYQNAITLADTANILLLSSAFEIDAFTEQYGTEYRWSSFIDYPIEWAKIADEYQGIIIAPYVWQRRLCMDGNGKTDWYYPWDCASGCIWDAAAIAKIGMDEP